MTNNISTDIAIIGGGINGLGIARELALRNISCTLIEKNDIVSGTSSASSKLVHGGLRYLKQGNFKLVYEALKERHFLLKNAPRLVKPLPFLVPIYRNGPVKKWQFKLGLLLYDLLCKFHQIKPHQFFSKAEFQELLPQINHDQLTGGALYYDAQMDDARIGIEIAIEASRKGAQILTYTEVNQIKQTPNNITLSTLNHHSQKRQTITAKYAINATGPWSNLTAKLENTKALQLVQLSKGTHIIVPKLTENNALLLLAKEDNRVFFILPWQTHYSLIGTTDRPYTDHPDHTRPTKEEIHYLLNETNHIFPTAKLTSQKIISTFAGLRPLKYLPNCPVGTIPRDYELTQNHRLFHLTGGKYTTFRKISEECSQTIIKQLNPNTKFKSITQKKALIGAQYTEKKLMSYFRLWQSQYPFLTEPLFKQLSSTYGKESYQIIKIMSENTTYTNKLHQTNYYIAEIIYFIRFTFAKTISDIIRRRTTLFYNDPQIETIITLIGKYIQKEHQLSSTEIKQQEKEALELTRIPPL